MAEQKGDVVGKIELAPDKQPGIDAALVVVRELESRITRLEQMFERVLASGLGSISSYEVREWRMKRGLKP